MLASLCPILTFWHPIPGTLIYLKQISKSLLVPYFPAKTQEKTKIKYVHLAHLLCATTVFFVFPLFLQKTFFIQEKKHLYPETIVHYFLLFSKCLFRCIMWRLATVFVHAKCCHKGILRLFLLFILFERNENFSIQVWFFPPSLLLVWHFVKMFLQLPRIADFMQHSC